MTLWVVRAGVHGEQEDAALTNNVVTIGWNELDNLSGYGNFDLLYEYYKSVYPENTHDKPTDYEKSVRLLCGEVWRFLDDVKIGDYVVLPSKKTKNIFIGKIIGNYEYKLYAYNVKHTRKVEWLKTLNRLEVPKEINNSFNTGLTVFEIKENNAENFIKSILGEKEDKFEKGEKIIKNYLLSKTSIPFVDFEHPTLIDEVEYKLKIRDKALEKLQTEKWFELIKTPGEILECLRNACAVSGNLLVHQYNAESNSDGALYQITKINEFEIIIYDFFTKLHLDTGILLNKIIAFIEENNAKSDWRFYAYLLFLLDADKYFPITPTIFDKGLEFYGVDERLSYQEKSWEKYSIVLDLVNELRSKLASKYGTTTILQAQSYLWVLIQSLEKDSPIKKNNVDGFVDKTVEGKVWIYSVDPENWNVVKNHNIWASSVSIEKIGERIHQNDHVIFFVTGTKKFKGIFKFSSDWYTAKSVVWPNETDDVIYLSQIKLEPIAIRDVDLWDVAKKLDYFPDSENKRDSSLKLQGKGGYPSNKESLSRKDFEILLDEMKPHYFVALGPWGNWNHSLSRTPVLWGVKPDSSGTNIGEFDRLYIGDFVFFYVTLEKPSKFSKYGFFGVGKVVRKCPHEKELYWPNETNEAKYTHRFQIEPIKILENDDDLIWFDGLPNTKGLAGIKSDNPGLGPLLDAVKNKWNVNLDENNDKFYLYQNNPDFPVLRKAEIDKFFGINYASGISDYGKNDFIVLISSLAGVYRDKVGVELITYTGKGQQGDQTLTGGNLGIVNAKNQGRKLYFLEELEGPTGKRTHDYRYLGEVEYLGHYFEDEPTENRKVIRFLLKRVNGPWDLRLIQNPSEKHIESITWNPKVDFNKTTQTIQLPKEIREQFHISEKDRVRIKLDTVPITSSFTSGYEIQIPEDVRKYLKTKQNYSCTLEKINPVVLQNINEFDLSHYNQSGFEIKSKIISFQKIDDDYYFDCHGHVGNFEQDQCTDSFRNLMLPITSKLSSFCSEPVLMIEEIELKNKLQKIITDASYGISGQKPLVLITILYWLSKNKFKEGSLIEYLKNLKKLDSDDVLELLIHNSTLFSDYVLVYKLYEAVGLMRFEIDRIGYHIKQSLEMNTNEGRLISDLSEIGLNESLSEIEPDRAKILLYNLLKENLDESTLSDFWNSLYGDYYAIKCPSEILEKIKNQPNFDPESPVIEINSEIYDSLMSQFSEITKTKEVYDGKLRIPTKNEVQKGIKEIQKELLIDDSIIEEIVTHLASGRHVLLAGPVGTGKTRLSQLIPGIFWTDNCGYYADVRTATADWNTQDVIGGISPKINDVTRSPTYEIENGCVTDTILANYEKFSRETENPQRHTSIHTVDNKKRQFNGTWLVIDEFNRADIDKAFGQLFTALEYNKLIIQNIESGKSTRTVPIPEDYRIIGTLNTADKHYLFNLSDALKRRFAYVEVSIPSRTKENREREIYLAVKNALNDLDSEKFTDIIKINPDNDTMAYQSNTIQKNIEYSFNMMELVREFKPLGTAILKAIYQTLLVSEKMENKDSFDNAINANLIPQLETMSKPTLKILYEYLFGNLDGYLKKETHKEQYQAGFEAILRYLKHSEAEIDEKMTDFRNGNSPEDLGTKIEGMKADRKISFIDSSLFKNSLEEILKQSEF